jgi:hypothetical protein
VAESPRPSRPLADPQAGAQTGGKPPFPGCDSRCHQGSPVVWSLLRVSDRAVEIRRGCAAGASPDEV